MKKFLLKWKSKSGGPPLTAVIKVDDYDAHLLRSHAYCAPMSRGYPTVFRSAPGGGTILLSHEITDCADGLQVLHINGDGFDFRRCNLRVGTKEQINKLTRTRADFAKAEAA